MTVPKLPTYKDFKSDKWAVMLFILLCYFVYKEFRDDECDDLRNALATSEARAIKAETANEKLTTALLVKNGVIDAILQTVDSTARVKLSDKPNIKTLK